MPSERPESAYELFVRGMPARLLGGVPRQWCIIEAVDESVHLVGDTGAYTELDAKELTALKVYFTAFDYGAVAEAVGMTYRGAAKLVQRAIKVRTAELLQDVDQLIIAQVDTFIRDMAALEPLIHRPDGGAPSFDAIDRKLRIWGRLSELLGLDRPVRMHALVATITREDALAIRDARWAQLGNLPALVDSMYEESAGPLQVTAIIPTPTNEVPPTIAPPPPDEVEDQGGLPSPWDEPDPEGEPVEQDRYGVRKPKQYRAPVRRGTMSGGSRV